MKPLSETFDPDRWIPPPDLVEGYRVSRLVRHLGMASMAELADRALREPEWYYPAALDFLGMRWLRPYRAIHESPNGDEAFRRWFVGGGTNLSWSAVERWDDPGWPAIEWESEGGDRRTLSYPELGAAVRSAAAGFRRLGVTPGDVVTMHLPPIPEALVTMLAVARIGAIVAPAFSGYGVDPLTERMRLAGAKVVVTADGTVRRGRRFEMLHTALAAADAIDPPPTVVVVERLGDGAADRRQAVSWGELLPDDDRSEPEVWDAATPWLLAFTSGSTGRPKGAVHTHGGIPLGLTLELGLSLDTRPGDRFFYPADMGWIAGAFGGIGPLLLQATTILYDGVTDVPNPDRIWQLIEGHRITDWGLSPTTARLLAAAGERWLQPYELPSLRIMGSAGEPWTTAAWKWLHRHVGRGRVPIVNFSGGTEVGTTLLTCYPNLEIPAGRFTGPALGMALDVVDESGRSVVGEEGELVVRRSWPYMTKSLWHDDERYVESYWSTFPGVWLHGDRAIRHHDGSWEILGRSDDVMKIAGRRVGPTEIESAAAEVDGVTGAVAVGVQHPTKGQALVVVVTVADAVDHRLLKEAVADRIADGFGKPMRPFDVVVVDTLPYTRSGKVHRRVLRSWIDGRDPGDLSTLENPSARDVIAEASEPVRVRLAEEAARSIGEA